MTGSIIKADAIRATDAFDTNCAVDTKLCHARRLCRWYPTFGSSILWSGLISQRRHHLHRRCASSLSITASLCPIWVRGDACTHMCKTYAHTLAVASLLLSLEIFYLEIGHRPQWQCVLYLPTSFCSKQVVRKVKLMALLAHCLAPYVCFISLQYLIPNICNLFCQTEEPSAYSSPVYFPLADGTSWSRWRWEQLADEGESINLVAFWFVGFTHGRLLLLYSIDWLSTSLSSPWQKILSRS